MKRGGVKCAGTLRCECMSEKELRTCEKLLDNWRGMERSERHGVLRRRKRTGDMGLNISKIRFTGEWKQSGNCYRSDAE